MSTMKRLSALLGAGALVFAMVGAALAVATGASDQGVTPTSYDNNIGIGSATPGKDSAACDAANGIETGDDGGSDTTDTGVTVTWTYDGDTKEFGFTATSGLVTIAYVKGGNSGYNLYDYTGFAGGGVSWDGGMFAPNTGADQDHPAGLSHAVFCTTPGDEPSDEPSFEQSQEGQTDEPSDEPSFEQSQLGETDEPSFEQSQEGATEPSTDAFGTNGTSGPADGAWLLVVALGVLLGSVVVLTPARAKSRR